MRLAFLTLLLVAPGCVANHRILLESDPPGVHVEMNGEYLGQTPMEYVLISPFAETIWPQSVRMVGRKPPRGWKPDVKQFDAHSQLPRRIFFRLEPELPRSGRKRAKAPDRDVGGSEYETLEEQKRRLLSW